MTACQALGGENDALAVGMGFLNGVTAMTEDMLVCENEGFGVFHDSTGAVNHLRLASAFNTGPGICTQNSEYLQLTGAIAIGNTQAGLMAINTGFVSTQGGEFSNTAFGAFDQNTPGAGDGIQLDNSAADLFDIVLTDNDRVGAVINLGSQQSLLDYRFDVITVTGSPQSFGFIAQQGGEPLPLITEGVTRGGTLLENDTLFIELGAVFDLVGEQDPSTWMPKVDQVVQCGLFSVFRPFRIARAESVALRAAPVVLHTQSQPAAPATGFAVGSAVRTNGSDAQSQPAAQYEPGAPATGFSGAQYEPRAPATGFGDRLESRSHSNWSKHTALALGARNKPPGTALNAGSPLDGLPLPTCGAQPIPTASTWGLMILTILLLTAAKIAFPTHRPAHRI